MISELGRTVRGLTALVILVGVHTHGFSAEEKPMIEAVIVHLKLGSEFGSESERAEIAELADHLTQTIEVENTGEFDGPEFGGGECVLYMYGPSADRLFEAVGPVLTPQLGICHQALRGTIESEGG